MIVTVALIGANATGQEEECYNYKKPLQCPSGKGAEPHGTCSNAPYMPGGSTDCRVIGTSYCDGTDYAGYCGSECATDTDPTGLRCNGSEQKNVPANYYVADFSCGDYDEIVPGYGEPIHVICGAICSNAQPAKSTTLTITDVATTQDGCPFHD
jgi:hypothetical protein